MTTRPVELHRAAGEAGRGLRASLVFRFNVAQPSLSAPAEADGAQRRAPLGVRACGAPPVGVLTHLGGIK
jgi:hypothetical protein